MSASPFEREPLLTPRFAAMWAYSFFTFFSAFQLLPAIPFRILELGGTKAQAGWFLAAYTFASAFAAPVMGTIADHVGRQKALVGSSTLFIIFSVAYGMLENLWLLMAVGTLHGAMWSSILASSSAIMSSMIPQSRRTQGLAWWGMASTAAVAIAPAVGISIFQAWGWATLCVELAILSLALALAGAWLPVDPHPRPERRPTLSDTWDLRVTQTALSLTVVSFGYGGITSYAALLSIERGIRPESTYYTVCASTILLVRITTSHLGDRWGAKRLLYPSLIAVPIAFAILAFASNIWMLGLSAALFGFGFGWMYPAFATFVLSNTDPMRRARTFGSIVWAFDTGIGCGSFAIGAVAQRYSFKTAFLFAAILACTAIPIFGVMSRRLVGR